MRFVENCGYIATSFRTIQPRSARRPSSVAEAVSMLDGEAHSCVVAGGTDLPAKFNEGLLPSALIDVSRLKELRLIEHTAGGLVIGAAVTHADGAAHPLVRDYSPGFAVAWSKIANVRVRFSATIGGNLMARRTRYEGSILLSALGAKVRLQCPRGSSEIPADALWTQDVDRASLLTAIVLPIRKGLRFDYERSLRPIMTQAVTLDDDGFGRVVTATEYTRPITRMLDAERRLLAPLEVADPVTSAGYLDRASRTFLARQLARMALS